MRWFSKRRKKSAGRAQVAVARFGPPDLGKLEAGGDTTGLVKALGHQDVSIRRGAARALGDIGGNDAVDPLTAALADEDRSVRLAAVQALGTLADPRAVDGLIAALNEHDNLNDVRSAAAAALGRISDPRVAEALVTHLRDTEPVRVAAAGALDGLGWRPSDSDTEVAYCIATGDVGRCVEVGAAAVDPLTGLLDRGVWRDAGFAIDVLGQIGDRRAVDPLISAYGEANKARGLRSTDDVLSVPVRIIEALGALGDTKAVELLISALGRGEEVNRAAVGALTGIGEPAVDQLAAAIGPKGPHRADAIRIGLLLVDLGVPIGDPRLRAVHERLEHWAAMPDTSEVGYDDDWKKIDDHDDGSGARDSAHTTGERLVATWVSKGATESFSEIDLETGRDRLLACLGSDLDWRTKGEVAALLVEHGMRPDDPVLEVTRSQLQTWSSKPDEEREIVKYLVETTSYEAQRQTAAAILARMGLETR